MSEGPISSDNACNWDFSALRDRIVTFDLDFENTMAELISYLNSKYEKEERSVMIGFGEIARPINRKMAFFNPDESHSYVRLRLSVRKGAIEEQDAVPLSLKLRDSNVNKIVVRIRSSTNKLTPIRICDGHGSKFRTRVGINIS